MNSVYHGPSFSMHSVQFGPLFPSSAFPSSVTPCFFGQYQCAIDCLEWPSRKCVARDFNQLLTHSPVVFWSLVVHFCVFHLRFLANIHVRYMLSPVRLSVVCLQRSCALLRRFKFSAIFLWHYLGYPWTSAENFTEIVRGEPLRRGSWTQEG